VSALAQAVGQPLDQAAAEPAASHEATTLEVAAAAKRASRVLAPLSAAIRNAALEAMAVALEASAEILLAANREDMAAAYALSEDEQLPAATLARLKLDAPKLREMIDQVRSVAALPDPLGRRLDAIELDDEGPMPVAPTSQSRDVGHPHPDQGRQHPDDGLEPGAPRLASETWERSSADAQGLTLEKLSVPLGVLAVIFEARPDAVTQIAALAIKSGNAVLLKPGREVERTAAALVSVLREALAQAGLPPDAIALILGRERVAELLAAHQFVDLVIPRGSKSLVEYVQANTRIPVLGHAEGVCHIYVDRAADPALALRVIDDAKTDYPAACNAVETVLIHSELAAEFLPRLAEHLRSRGIALHGDDLVRTLLRGFEIEAVADWHTEYGSLDLSLAVVSSLDAAIDHIHAHGSSHTESILTEDPAAAERFLAEVDAASVIHNASTRFADGFRYGFGAEVGISTSKLHARGPVGLEGLTTYKYVLRGHGHIAGDYRGPAARPFTHRRTR
jgi:glutamate-5-semialdehyde dehydrogenase